MLPGITDTISSASGVRTTDFKTLSKAAVADTAGFISWSVDVSSLLFAYSVYEG